MAAGATPRHQWLTPSRALPAIALVLLALVIFTPQSQELRGGRLTTYATDADGARGMYDVLHRLGYQVSRRTVSMVGTLDSQATYVLLAPPLPLSTAEVNHILAAVRRGAGLIVVTGSVPTQSGTASIAALRPDALIDSLGFRVTAILAASHATMSQLVVTGGRMTSPSEMEDLSMYPVSPLIALRDSVAPEGVPFLWLQPRGGATNVRAIVLGRPFGNGHVVAVSAGYLLGNQFLRDGRPAAAVVHALEWMNAAHRPIVFDEYHQGFGTHPNVARAVGMALTDTAAGRMTLEVIAAALMLLLAMSVRPLPPIEQLVFLRRSPLEHVSALASAYAHIDAKQFGTEYLVRGLRRRHPFGVARSVSHEHYLATVRTRFPSTGGDVDTIQAALRGTSHAHFPAISAAIAHSEAIIEQAMTSVPLRTAKMLPRSTSPVFQEDIPA